MSEFSRAQEREEKRRIGSGVKTSVFALLLSWAPFLGVLLGSVGFVKITGSVTRRYRGRRRTGMLFALFVLIAALALTTWEVYVYTHEPWIVDDAKDWFMDRLTGGAWYGGGGYDYSTQQSYGMGMDSGAFIQGYTPDGYYNEQGEFVPYADGGQPVVGENETGG